MTRPWIGLIGLSLALTIGTNAHAAWQYTTWEMTPEQVIAASGGKVHPHIQTQGEHISNSPITAQAAGTYTSGAYDFTTVFYFNNSNNKLSRIDMELKNSTACYDLKTELEGKYGPPEKATDLLEIWIWRDKAKNNRINLLRIGEQSCSLSYIPLVTADAAGL
jgi:hypothetical protein